MAKSRLSWQHAGPWPPSCLSLLTSPKTPHLYCCPQTPSRLGFLETKATERTVPWVGKRLQSTMLSGRLPH